MRIWLDVSALTRHDGEATGCIRVEKELLEAVLRLKDWGLLNYVEKSGSLHYLKSEDFETKPNYRDVINSLRSAKKKFNLQPDKNDVFLSVGVHATDRFMSQIRAYASAYDCKIVMFVHDVIPILFPEYGNSFDADVRFNKFISDVRSYSDLVLVNSESTKNDIQALFPDLLPQIIYLGEDLETESNPFISSNASQHVPTTSNYCIYVSTFEPRKNHKILINVYLLAKLLGTIKEMPDLFLVGRPGWGDQTWVNTIESDPVLSKKIQIHTSISDQKLMEFYSGSKAVLFPSFYEGWGLAVSEARKFNKLCIISNGGALKEHKGSLVKILPPDDTIGWYHAILNIPSSPFSSSGTPIRTWSQFCEEVLQSISALLRNSDLTIYSKGELIS